MTEVPKHMEKRADWSGDGGDVRGELRMRVNRLGREGGGIRLAKCGFRWMVVGCRILHIQDSTTI
jgi:hypothetical protein